MQWCYKTRLGVFFLLAAICCSGASKPGNSELYDNAGPIYIGAWEGVLTGPGYCKLKTFIWDHWNNRRRGTVLTRGSSIEGEPAFVRYSIEPDRGGRWRVSGEATSQILDRKARRARQVKSMLYYYDVVRVESSKGSNANKVIPINAKRSSDSYILILKGPHGNTEL